jgi:phenylacetate-coenzyme A ligase PaaK-like adenylate-forming protein
MSGLAELRNDLRNEVRYGLRFLVRESTVGERRVSSLLANERLPPEELRPITDRLLFDTLKAATRQIPRFRSIKVDFNAANARDVLAERFPVIGRAELLGGTGEFFPKSGTYPWTAVGRTSGTSGTPLKVYRSLDSVLWENAFIERQFRWAGYRPGMPRAYLRGDTVVPINKSAPPYWFHNRYNNQLVLSSRHLREPCVGALIAELARFEPFMLQAYPSTAYELALLLEKRNESLTIPYIFTASEPTYPHQRQLIEERLGGRVMEYYGMAERVAYASECERGNLHVNTDYSYVEIVDEDGKPTSGDGYIVGTTFHNTVMPLVRYRVSDRTRWRKESCPCGRTYPLVEPVTGKFEDTLYGARGQRISPSVVTFIFKSLDGIERSQVAQVGASEWEIRVVPAAGYGQAQRNRLVQNVRELVDPDLNVTVREVDDIARTSAHKYRWIVNEYSRSS